MKKVIITGANGFLGSALTKYLIQHNVQIAAFTHAGHRSNIPENALVTVYPYEMDTPDDIMRNREEFSSYDAFYHFAWESVAGRDRGNPEIQLRNVSATILALKTAHRIGCKRFIGIGSIMEDEVIAIAERQGIHPGLGYVYGTAKFTAHAMCQSIAADLGIDFIWTKLTNAYGVGEKSKRMVNTAIRKCNSGISPSFTAATQNYDFVYIDDVARAYYLIGENGKPFHTYLIGSSHARPLKEFLQEMQQSIAPEIPFQFGKIPFTGINLDITKFDCSDTENDTGFRAEISFAEGTRRTMAWMREHGE